MKKKFGGAIVCLLAFLGASCASSKECDESPAGSGQITGSVLSSGFDTIAAAYKLGHVDVPGITVLFGFSKTVTCCEMQDEGWDERVKNGTLMVEISLTGTTAGTYPVSTAAEPPAGEASVVAKYKSTAGLQESEATAGTVIIDSISGGKVVGSFDVTFADGQASGSLSAADCADGAEP